MKAKVSATSKYIEVKTPNSWFIQELDWGTSITFTVWEPGSVIGTHSTITTINGKWYGRLGTRMLTPELADLPAGTDYRVNMVNGFRLNQENIAYSLILNETGIDPRNLKCSDGEMEFSQGLKSNDWYASAYQK